MSGIYLVTDQNLMGNRNIEEVVSQAVQGGVCIVQLREKNISLRLFIEKAQKLKKILTPHNIPLIINDRIDVALAVKADGVHIGQDDIPYYIARNLLGKNAIIGLSVENLTQVEEAQNFDVDYLGISSIFPTDTKSNLNHIWGLEGLQKVRKISKHNLIAIGGINAENAASVFQAGADGIAVVSNICAAKDPKSAAKKLYEIYIRNKNQDV